MASNTFTEGVRPGGLTNATELRILLCYLLDNIARPITREQIETVLLGEELVNYFLLAESLTGLEQQGLITHTAEGFAITKPGHTVAETLANDVPRSVRDTAVRGVIRLQQYAAKAAAHQASIAKSGSGYCVSCSIGDATGGLFAMDIHMPDTLSAENVQHNFVQHGNEIYKLLLAALTGDHTLAQESLNQMEQPHEG